MIAHFWTTKAGQAASRLYDDEEHVMSVAIASSLDQAYMPPACFLHAQNFLARDCVVNCWARDHAEAVRLLELAALSGSSLSSLIRDSLASFVEAEKQVPAPHSVRSDDDLRRQLVPLGDDPPTCCGVGMDFVPSAAVVCRETLIWSCRRCLRRL